MKGTITITATDDGKQTTISGEADLEHVGKKDKLLALRSFLNLLEISPQEAKDFVFLIEVGIADTLVSPANPAEPPESTTNHDNT